MNAAPRIAFVSPRLPEGPTVGGAETLLRSLAARLAAAGWDVTFFTTCARDHFTWRNEIPPGVREVNGLRVHFFPADERRNLDAFLRIQEAICHRQPVTREQEETWLENGVMSRELTQYLREHIAEFDRIVAGPYLFGLTWDASRVCPAKTVLVPCLHDEAFAYLDTMREMFRSAGHVMFNSDPERDLGLRLYDLSPARCSVVGMGVDDFESDPRAFAARRGLEAPYLIYCGRREPLKGTPLLLDYVSAFRARTAVDIKLVLTGTGPIEMPPGLHPHVMDLGFVSEADKHEAMAGALAFCHPSVNESLSIVLLESWLARTPALVHACSAVMREQCRRSNGGLWFQTYPEFEEEVLLLLRQPEIRNGMGMMGRQYVLNAYAWPEIERKLKDALTRPVSGLP